MTEQNDALPIDFETLRADFVRASESLCESLGYAGKMLRAFNTSVIKAYKIYYKDAGKKRCISYNGIANSKHKPRQVRMRGK